MRFAFPITKFRKLDDGRLEIEGLASDETIDSQGDIVDFDGLKRAAVHWRGNIREAHDPQKPVGRALEISFNDQERKMFVRSFVSAGAPETQAKVLDGTLRAYSVGGSNPTRVTYEKIGDLRVRRVHDWNMSELSLVDAPANPNANFELIKADGTATAALADDVLEAAAQKVANRFADAVLDALEKGKGGQAPPKGKGGQRPPARAAGDAETVEETKDGAGVTADFAETGFDAEAQRGGTGTGTDTMTGAKSPDVLTSSPDGKQSLAPKLPASGVEPAGAAPGTSQANVSPAVGADARTIVASAAAPTTAGQNADGPTSTAEAVENAKPAPGTAGPDSAAAVRPPAAGVEAAGAAGTPSTAGPDSAAAVRPPAAGVEAAGAAGTPSTAGPTGDVTQVAEAGGDDTEKDTVDGSPRSNPKGKPVTVPRGNLAGKAEESALEKRDYTADERKRMADKGEAMKDGSYPIKTKADLANAIQSFGRAKNKPAVKAHIKRRARALGAADQIPDSWKTIDAVLAKFFWGGEQNDVADAARVLSEVLSLYQSEAAEGEDESPQLDLLAAAIAALQRFIALEGLELADQTLPVPPTPQSAVAEANPGPPDQSIAAATGAALRKDMEEELPGSLPAADPDTVTTGTGSAPSGRCAKCGGVMSCAKCQKDEGGVAMAAGSTFGKSGALMFRFLDAVAFHMAKTKAPRGVFKVNDGDQLAAGIGSGLSIVSGEITKANADLKGLIESEIKGVRDAIGALAKTAAVPMPLRSVPAAMTASVSTAAAGVEALKTALASVTNPEAQAQLRQQIAVAEAVARPR